MKVRTKINGDNWKIKVVTQEEMREQKKSDEGFEFAGLCVAEEKTIYIDEDSIETRVITHELYHAYFSYLYLDDTNNLTLLDLEEITANFFCNKANDILKQAKTIYKKLKKQQETE